ncbi:hypothetical protein BayCH28_00575 [Mycolicibacterium sp. CH28]|uniref:hypothetical protein n=1 Tax=Mycolicibacterium sp. CH28 TaxID=2512237 RepID=UPI0010815A27|nr:hypothetical protein [Mycolicibacterium sp. CH28]TGD90397.1 hypothetical protein BayCH28_00575 [Mycolicibacterium sp. CH28]
MATGVVGLSVVDVGSVAPSVAALAVVLPPVEVGVEVVVEAGVSVAPGAIPVPAAMTARAEPADRADTEEPLLEADTDGLPVGRVRAGPADPSARPALAEWPELPAACGDAPESEEPPSVVAEATSWPTPTARPIPTAAAKMPLRAARVRFLAARLR